MRLSHAVALSVLSCGILAASSPRDNPREAPLEATYVVGNLDGMEAGAEGSLGVDSDRLLFRAEKTSVDVPFRKIVQVELGPTLTHSVDVPLYKVWQLHKRFLAEKPTYQNLTLNFKGDDGKEQSMTLEMLERATLRTYDTILIKTGRKPRHPKEDWWGDSVWRTNRTNPDWEKRNAEDLPVTDEPPKDEPAK